MSNKIRIYFNENSSMQFYIEDIKREDILSREWWIERISNELIERVNLLDSELKKPTDFYLYNIETYSREIEIYSRLLKDLNTSSYQKLFILTKELENNELSFDIYMNEEEYKTTKKYFLYNVFFYNKNIKEDKDLLNLLNKTTELAKKEIELLESFNFENINLNLEEQKDILDLDLTLELIKKTNKLKVNSEFEFNGCIIKKVEPLFPKKENLYNKSAIIINIKEQNIQLYYENNFFQNNLLFVNFEEQGTVIGMNSKYGTLFDLLQLFLMERVQEFSFPRYEITDEETNLKIKKYINEH